MDKKKFSNEWVFLFIVIAMAVVLRFVYIDIPLWYDEACSWFTAIQKFPFGIIDNLLTLDLQHTPLYFFALHFWMKMFGDTEVMLRVFSLIFGVGTVPLVYFLQKNLNKTNCDNFNRYSNSESTFSVFLNRSQNVSDGGVFSDAIVKLSC